MRNFSEGDGDYYERRRKIHVVYKIYDADGEMIYVGMTSDLDRRLAAHKRTKPWWGEVAEVGQERFPIMADARNRERDLIVSRRPKYNENGWRGTEIAQEARAKKSATKAARLRRLGIDIA